MIDKYGRTVDYMRISIIDRCNLRCKYCMPDDIQWISPKEILSLEEIAEICRQASQIGIRKIKLTGGEPLVRKGCVDLLHMIKTIPGIEQVTLTTNGVLLEQYAEQLSREGLDAVNVSLDTLDREKFQKITGFDALADVLKGIEAIEQSAIPLKINAVLQPGVNDNDWQDLAELARNRLIDVRFIEMMPIGYGKKFESVSNTVLLQKMQDAYGLLKEDSVIHGNGPATYRRIPGFQGSIGFISAIHGKFCHSCNRIRLTSTGLIKPCLCYEEHVSLKEAVRNGSGEEIQRLLIQAIGQKPKAHCFTENPDSITETHEMAKIGG